MGKVEGFRLTLYSHRVHPFNMGRKRFHSLKQVKFRASWNKYNLYNLTRLKPINTAFLTFYQQKWKAKSMSRGYHGEQIRAKQWQRMFTPKLNAVVPMDPRYLAENDGSELAAGRGSGLEQPVDPTRLRFGRKNIPYMHMTYAPIEKRLDMAIFRALFASSAKKARQLRKSSTRVNITKDKFRTARREKRAAERAARMEKEAAAEAAGEAVKPRVKAEKPTLEDNIVIRQQRQADAVELLKQADLLFNNRRKPLSAKQKQGLRTLVK